MEPESRVMEQDRDLAGFSDRVVAFSLDILLFMAGYALTLKLFFAQYPLLVNPHAGSWSVLWTALFLVYQAFSSCEGRRSLGKALLGIRVVTLDREPLGLGAAILRSATYLVSSILNLGFLWALFNPTAQCWHDMVVGSVVVQDEPKGPGLRLLVRAVATACLVVVAGQWYWHAVLSSRYKRVMDVAYAQVGLKEISTLERLYYRRHGRYAEDLSALAPLTGAPEAFLRDMGRLFDERTGVRIQASKSGFTIHARATDVDRTLIAYNGP